MLIQAVRPQPDNEGENRMDFLDDFLRNSSPRSADGGVNKLHVYGSDGCLGCVEA